MFFFVLSPIAQSRYIPPILSNLPTGCIVTPSVPQIKTAIPEPFFGYSFRNQAQLNIFKLFLSSLNLSVPFDDPSKRVVLSTSIAGGFGDYAYVDKTALLVKKYLPTLSYKAMFSAYESDASRTLKETFRPSYENFWVIKTTDEKEFLNLDAAADYLQDSKFSFYLAAMVSGKLLKYPETAMNRFSIEEIYQHGAERLIDCAGEDCHKKEVVLKGRHYVASFYNQFYREFKKREDSDCMTMSQVLRDFQGVAVDDFSSDLASGYEYDKNENCSALPPFRCKLSPQFGFGKFDAGFLFDEDVAEKVKNYGMADVKENTSFGATLKDVPDEVLGALTDQEAGEQEIAMHKGADYYFSYTNNEDHSLLFALSLLSAYPDKSIKLIAPLKVDSIIGSAWYNEINRLELKKLNVDHVNFWSRKAGWKKIGIQRSGGRSLTIINPFPLLREQFLALSFFSNMVVGTTGDQSLYEAISMGKLPFHEFISYQFMLRSELESIAFHPMIKKFLKSPFPAEIGESIKFFEKEPAVTKEFLTELVDKFSANNLLRAIIAEGDNPSSSIRALLGKIDDIKDRSLDEQEMMITQLSVDQQDVARTRIVFWLAGVKYETRENQPVCIPGADRELSLKESFKQHISRISNPYLQKNLEEVASSYLKKYCQ